MIEVELPDGSIAEFPEGTPREEMRAAIQRRFPAQSRAPMPRGNNVALTAAARRDADIVGDVDLQDPSALVQAIIKARQEGDALSERRFSIRLQNLERELYDPTRGMSTAERAAAGVGRSIVETGRGIGQLIGTYSPEEYQQARELDRSLTQTTAGFLGNIGGSVAQIVGPGVGLRAAASVPQAARVAPALNTASRAFLPTTFAGNVAQGVTYGAIQPVGPNESRLFNAGVGAGAGGAGFLASRAVGAAADILSPQSAQQTAERQAAQVIRENVPNADALRFEQSRIPGVQRTAAQATGNRDVAALERWARSLRTAGFEGVDQLNNDARVAALQRIGKDEDALAAAIRQRDAQTGPLRSAALKEQNVDINSVISALNKAERKLKGRDEVKGGITEIRRRLTEAQRVIKGQPASSIVGPDGQPLVAATADIRGGAPMDELYNIRLAIGDMLAGKANTQNPAALAGSRELIAARDYLDRAIAKRVPEFKQYLEAYKSASRGINRVQIGQAVIRQGSSPIGDDVAPMLQPQKFSQSTRGIGSDRLESGINRPAQAATGFRKARAEQSLTPDDMATIKAVRDDLARQFNAARSSGGGSPTFERMEVNRSIMRRAAGLFPSIREVLDMADDKAQERVFNAIGEALLDPAKLQAIIKRYPENERRLIRDSVNRLTLAGSAPAAIQVTSGP